MDAAVKGNLWAWPIHGTSRPESKVYCRCGESGLSGWVDEPLPQLGSTRGESPIRTHG